jgi:hypothetical protein
MRPGGPVPALAPTRNIRPSHECGLTSARSNPALPVANLPYDCAVADGNKSVNGSVNAEEPIDTEMTTRDSRYVSGLSVLTAQSVQAVHLRIRRSTDPVDSRRVERPGPTPVRSPLTSTSLVEASLFPKPFLRRTLGRAQPI